MTLRHFKIYVTVCDTMNMTIAGERLFLSQSAVSQAISELERHYETKLFDRLSRKLYLTPSGHKLLSYARHIVSMNEEAACEMKNLKEQGYLRIGASVTVCTCVLPKYISKCRKLWPRTKTEVYEENTERIEDLLLHNNIDLGIVEGCIKSGDIISLPYLEDELVPVCGAEHPFHNRKEISPSQLSLENFIIREAGSGTRKTFEEVMSANQISWNAGWICNNVDTIKSAVQENLGITVISERAVQRELQRGELIRLYVPGLEFKRTFKICYHKYKYHSEAMDNFIDLVKQYHPMFVPESS